MTFLKYALVLSEQYNKTNNVPHVNINGKNIILYGLILLLIMLKMQIMKLKSISR